MNQGFIIEACVASVEAAVAAERGGADRLELNCALELDGLTPSIGLFKEVRAVTALPIIVMIRPRGFGFHYSESEYKAMRTDIDTFLSTGADGIATGFLTPSHNIDRLRTTQVAKWVENKSFVFHRAFDITPSMSTAMEKLVDCGVDRILTSGQRPTAIDGVKQIRQLIAHAEGRIEVLPGAGVKPENIEFLVSATGCDQLHGTFRSNTANTPSMSGLEKLKYSPPPGTDASVVAKVREIVDRLHFST